MQLKRTGQQQWVWLGIIVASLGLHGHRGLAQGFLDYGSTSGYWASQQALPAQHRYADDDIALTQQVDRLNTCVKTKTCPLNQETAEAFYSNYSSKFKDNLYQEAGLDFTIEKGSNNTFGVNLKDVNCKNQGLFDTTLLNTLNQMLPTATSQNNGTLWLVWLGERHVFEFFTQRQQVTQNNVLYLFPDLSRPIDTYEKNGRKQIAEMLHTGINQKKFESAPGIKNFANYLHQELLFEPKAYVIVREAIFFRTLYCHYQSTSSELSNDKWLRNLVRQPQRQGLKNISMIMIADIHGFPNLKHVESLPLAKTLTDNGIATIKLVVENLPQDFIRQNDWFGGMNMLLLNYQYILDLQSRFQLPPWQLPDWPGDHSLRPSLQRFHDKLNEYSTHRITVKLQGPVVSHN